MYNRRARLCQATEGPCRGGVFDGFERDNLAVVLVDLAVAGMFRSHDVLRSICGQDEFVGQGSMSRYNR